MWAFTPQRGLQYLQKLGWSPQAAAGILGNLQHESNFNPTAVHDNGTGFGMAGWRDPQPGQGRMTALRDYARQTGKDVNDPFTQLDFLNQELRTSESKVGDLLRTAKTPAEAAVSFLGFERPSGWSPGGDPTKASGYNNRVKYAEQIAGGQGADTIYGGAGPDTMQTQPNSAPSASGQGLLNLPPEITQGLLATYQPTWQDKLGAGLSGIGTALAAAGSGSPNWGLIGGQAIQGALKSRKDEARQSQQQKALQAMATANPKLAPLLALGGPELAAKALLAQATPQDVMNIGGRVYDPNTRQFITPAVPEYQFVQDGAGNQIAVNKLDPTQATVIPGQQPKAPEFQATQDANGNPIAFNKQDPTQFTPIGAAQQKQTDFDRKLQTLGIDPATLTPEQKQQLAGITPQKPEVRELNGRLVAVSPRGTAQDITPEGMPAGARPMTAEERAAYQVPQNVGAYIGADGKPGTLSGGSTVNVNNAGETQFAKTAGEMQAKSFADLASQLPQIGQRELQLSQLGTLLQSVPQGTGAETSAWLSNVGRTLGLGEGQVADKAQAIQAIANQIVPTLRMAGSGTMSDRDVELFKSTLPQLSNTPGANQAILGILSRSVAAQRQIAEISAAAINGQISPADAQKQIGEIQILTPEERKQLEGMRSGALTAQPGGLRSSAGVTPQAIGGMSMDDLSRLDPRNLTEEQRSAAEKRWDELSGGANGGQ